MQEFTKKQIKGIIDIIKSESTQNRPALQTMRIRRDGYAYITNGYIAIRWKFELEPIPKDSKQNEFIIPVENLVKWYKLSSTKDTLNELTILDLQDTENDTQYPVIERLFSEKISEPTCEDIDVNLSLIEMVNKAVDSVKCDGINLQIHCGSIILGRNKQKDMEFLICGLTK